MGIIQRDLVKIFVSLLELLHALCQLLVEVARRGFDSFDGSGTLFDKQGGSFQGRHIDEKEGSSSLVVKIIHLREISIEDRLMEPSLRNIVPRPRVALRKREKIELCELLLCLQHH